MSNCYILHESHNGNRTKHGLRMTTFILFRCIRMTLTYSDVVHLIEGKLGTRCHCISRGVYDRTYTHSESRMTATTDWSDKPVWNGFKPNDTQLWNKTHTIVYLRLERIFKFLFCLKIVGHLFPFSFWHWTWTVNTRTLTHTHTHLSLIHI